MPSNTPIKVFAPASVANVAVGYDILGFAIEGPGDQIVIGEGKNPGLVIKEITGAKGKLPREVEKNTAGVAALSYLKELGEEKRPLEMTIHKKMPFGSGLGSSAASAAAGVFAVKEFLRTGHTKRELLKHAVAGEQVADGAWHADNVAPSLLGGVVFIRENESLDVQKVHVPRGLLAVVIYPHVKVLTKESRAILSDQLTLDQHIQQTGNLGGFLLGMANSDFDLIQRSLTDVIIEPQRAKLIPHFYKLKEMALEAGALGFSISGAGPSMFAMTNNSMIADQIETQAKTLFAKYKIAVDVFVSPINQEGAYKY